MRASRLLSAAALAALAVLGCRAAPPPPPPDLVLQPQTSGTSALLQAVSPVDDRVAWVSGHAGTWARTTDGGATWRAGRVAGADTLEFRDVEAVDSLTAYLLSAGNGPLSRIYKTTDGGRSWTLQFTNADSAAFYDCMAFWDATHGIAFSDAVNGEMVLLATSDGASWTRIPPASLPPALPGEGSFAASGSCVVTGADGRAWIGTGNGPLARVLRTTDRGRSWTVVTTPVVHGTGNGIASLAFRDALTGVAMGGRVGNPADSTERVARTTDGGERWMLAGRPRTRGALFGGAYVPGATPPALVAVGPGGLSLSRDDGGSWTVVDTLSYWSVAFASPRAGWAVGPNGRIVKLSLRK